MSSFILGVDLGGTKTAVVLGDRTARIFDRNEFATRPERGFGFVFDELCRNIDVVRAHATQVGRAPGEVTAGRQIGVVFRDSV